MKLFIDDIRPAPEGWQQARTVTDAIRFLSQFEVSEISLDHDISMLVEVDGTHRPFPSKETFMAVAYYICAKYWVEKKMGDGLIHTHLCEHPPKIIIHSANPVGAENMRKLFEEHGITAIINPASRVNRLETEI